MIQKQLQIRFYTPKKTTKWWRDKSCAKYKFLFDWKEDATIQNWQKKKKKTKQKKKKTISSILFWICCFYNFIQKDQTKLLKKKKKKREKVSHLFETWKFNYFQIETKSKYLLACFDVFCPEAREIDNFFCWFHKVYIVQIKSTEWVIQNQTFLDPFFFLMHHRETGKVLINIHKNFSCSPMIPALEK